MPAQADGTAATAAARADAQQTGSAAELLYLEDLLPGRVFETGTIAVDADAILRFAAEFDPQPFHLDPNAARETFFQGLAASGWHTAALTMRLLVDGPMRLAGGIIGGGVDELRWPRPVRPGDTLRARSEVLEGRPSRSKPDQGLVKMRTTTLNQYDEPVQIFVANLVVRRRSSS